jgi:hypothetical protein
MVQQWRALFSAWSRTNELNSLICSGSNYRFTSWLDPDQRALLLDRIEELCFLHWFKSEEFHSLIGSGLKSSASWLTKGVNNSAAPGLYINNCSSFPILLLPLVVLNTGTVQLAYQGFTPSIRQIEWGQIGYMYIVCKSFSLQQDSRIVYIHYTGDTENLSGSHQLFEKKLACKVGYKWPFPPKRLDFQNARYHRLKIRYSLELNYKLARLIIASSLHCPKNEPHITLCRAEATNAILYGPYV